MSLQPQGHLVPHEREYVVDGLLDRLELVRNTLMVCLADLRELRSTDLTAGEREVVDLVEAFVRGALDKAHSAIRTAALAV